MKPILAKTLEGERCWILKLSNDAEGSWAFIVHEDGSIVCLRTEFLKVDFEVFEMDLRR